MTKRRTGTEDVQSTRRQATGPKLSAGKRSREWEKRNPPLTYRVPQDQRGELQADVKRLANQYSVTVGEMAAWLLRRAIEQVDKGALEPKPRMVPGRLSLFNGGNG